jgi:hypothetical protein
MQEAIITLAIMLSRFTSTPPRRRSRGWCEIDHPATRRLTDADHAAFVVTRAFFWAMRLACRGQAGDLRWDWPAGGSKVTGRLFRSTAAADAEAGKILLSSTAASDTMLSACS